MSSTIGARWLLYSDETQRIYSNSVGYEWPRLWAYRPIGLSEAKLPLLCLPQRPSIWSSHTLLCSDSSFKITQDMPAPPAPPGFDDADRAAFVDALTNDPHARRTSKSSDDPTEVASGREETTSPLSSGSQRFVELDERSEECRCSRQG